MGSITFLPSSDRLLRGLRSTLRDLATTENLSQFALSQLSTADQVLNELLLRMDGVPYASIYAESISRVRSELSSAWFAASHLNQDQLRRKAAELPERFDVSLSADAFGRLLEAVLDLLSEMAEAAVVSNDPAARDFLDAALAKELALYELRRRPAASDTTKTRSATELRLSHASLSSYLSNRFPERKYVLTDLQVIPGGYQKTTALFAVRDEQGLEEPLVIRADKPDRLVRLDAGRVCEEYEIVRYVHDHGIPSAEPKWLERNPDALGASFMVTSRKPGKALSVAWLEVGRSFSDVIGQQGVRSVVETLAAIHNLPVKGLSGTCLGHWLGCSTLAENTSKAVAMWKRQPWWPHASTSPALVSALSWLACNVPAEDAPVSLLHTDYGCHNVLFDKGRVSAVLDWECARIGDPADDLTFLISNLGPNVDRAQILDWYRSAGGREISEQRLRYFDVYNVMKIAISGALAAALYENEDRAHIQWCNLALHIAGTGAAALLPKIKDAEALRQRLSIDIDT